MDNLIDWFYGQVVGFLGNFFAEMGNMGVELFDLDWVQAIVLFFSQLGWALFGVSLVVCIFECGIDYTTGRANIKDTALNILKGFLSVCLFTTVPVRLYSLSVTLQGTFASGLTGFGTSIGTVGQQIIEDLNGVESVTEMTGTAGNFGLSVITSPIMIIFCIILMAYAVIKVFFSNLKRGGILLIQIAVGSLYMFSIPRGYNRRGGGMMEYREVYFRIRSSYRYDSGWPDKGVEHAFRDETRTLFQSAGWELHPAREDSSSSDIVTKGQQDLYLHPMNFSGVIQTDEIPRLQELLEGAQTFQCQGVDCYERYWELTDAEYLKQLEARRDEIIEAILERYQTKRKNLYVTGPAELSIAKQFSVHRLCDKDGKNNLANRYVGELVERLIREGRLVTAETRNGLGIRTAAGEELRQRGEPLPGQQQMTL